MVDVIFDGIVVANFERGKSKTSNNKGGVELFPSFVLVAATGLLDGSSSSRVFVPRLFSTIRVVCCGSVTLFPPPLGLITVLIGDGWNNRSIVFVWNSFLLV